MLPLVGLSSCKKHSDTRKYTCTCSFVQRNTGRVNRKLERGFPQSTSIEGEKRRKEDIGMGSDESHNTSL